MPGVCADFSLTNDSEIIWGGGLLLFNADVPCTCCGMDRTDTGLFATGPSIGKEGGGGGGGIASSLAVHKQNSFRLNAFNFMVLSIAGKSMSGSPSPNLMQDT